MEEKVLLRFAPLALLALSGCFIDAPVDTGDTGGDTDPVDSHSDSEETDTQETDTQGETDTQETDTQETDTQETDTDTGEDHGCDTGEVWDGEACVPEACGHTRFGDIPKDRLVYYVDRANTGFGNGEYDSPFATIQEAVDFVSNEGGEGWLAIAGGSYNEAISVGGRATDIVIAGRCAELVTVSSASAKDGSPGLSADEVPALGVRGITFIGSSGRGLTLHATNALIEGVEVLGAENTGVVAEAGAVVEITDSNIDGNYEIGVLANDTGTTITLTNVSVSNSRAADSGEGGIGISVQNGGAVTGSELVLDGNQERGVQARGNRSILDLEGARILNTRARPDGTYGYGADVQSGGVFNCTDCVIQDNRVAGVYVTGNSSSVTLEGGEIRGTVVGDGWTTAVGLVGDTRATVRITDTVIADNEGPGLVIDSGGRFTVTGAELTGNRFAGVVLLDGRATLTTVTASDTTEDPTFGGGLGLFVAGRTGTREVAIAGGDYTGNVLGGVHLATSGTYDIGAATLEGSAGVRDGADTVGGYALYASGTARWDGTAGLHLDGVTFRGGLVGLLLDAGTATVSGATWTGNTVDLVQQRCDGIDAVEIDSTPANAELCTGTDRAVPDLQFSLTE